MKKDSLIDCTTFLLFRLLGACIRRMPLSLSLAAGRRMGDIFCFLDRKHRCIVYANIKRALGRACSGPELCRLTRGFYRNFGQSLIEVFLIPRIDKEYIDRYITIEGREYIADAFRRGKGVIFIGVHEGSWELYNIITASLGFPFHFLVGDLGERFGKVVGLLNEYRRQHGCRLIYRRHTSDGGARELIRVLRANEAVGMSMDQGGKNGVNVPFFCRDASMSTGALRLALKYDATLVPSFIFRRRGAYHTIVLEQPFELIRTGDLQQDVRLNLERLSMIFERHVRAHPQEYLWSYKIWKYSRERSILILDDGKAGHLRQSQAVARLAEEEYRRRGLQPQTRTITVSYRTKLRRSVLRAALLLSGRYSCQGCGRCLRWGLTQSVNAELSGEHPDLVISCGASVAGINYLVSRENSSRSVVVMKPQFLSVKRFDLVVLPEHDRGGTGKNVVRTSGALNLINEQYLREQVEGLLGTPGMDAQASGSYIGVLIGGDSRGFRLQAAALRTLVAGLKEFCGHSQARLLVSTSRRTPPHIEELLRGELCGYERCSLCVIANERNIPYAVGGILGLSSWVVCSPESISMISEASSSGRPVVVFDAPGLSAKHRRFLEASVKKNRIHLTEPEGLCGLLERLGREAAHRPAPNDDRVVAAALGRIL